MRLFDVTYIRDWVDYSFGDHSGLHTPDGYMRPANMGNQGFLSAKERVRKSGRDIMTLFIDNTRLYKRDIEKSMLTQRPVWSWKNDKERIYKLMDEHDLLDLCRQVPEMKFIIFSGFDDVPIDEFIHQERKSESGEREKTIPDNVLKIYASNAICFGGKVEPMPYGLQRRIHKNDDRMAVLRSMVGDCRVVPPRNDIKLLYVNHTPRTEERAKLCREMKTNSWCTVDMPNLDSRTYFKRIQEHKFMLCPDGNAVDSDCHRQWEVLYLRRVPVMRRGRYLEKVFEGLPVLFVNSYDEVTPELLQANDHLWRQAQEMDMNRLDVDGFYNSRKSIVVPNTRDFRSTPINRKEEIAASSLLAMTKEGKPQLPEGHPLGALGLDHIYCVNLVRRTDRKAHAEGQFAKEGIKGVEYWPARDGKAEGLTHPKKELTAGMIGCFLSHRALLRDALAKGYETVLVTEDDLVFVPGFRYIMEEAMEELPDDWDMLYLGYSEHSGFKQDVRHINAFWANPISIWGTQAYVVRGRKTIETIVEGLKIMEEQVDIQLIHKILPKSGLKYYCVFPSVIRQAAEWLGSDVQPHGMRAVESRKVIS